MSKLLITKTNDEKEVYVFLTSSSIAVSISRQPHLVTLIKEVISPLNLTAPQISIEQDMGRTIGYSEQLKTVEKDIIFYARQLRSQNYTRFVKNRKTESTSFLSVSLLRDEDGNYEVKNVWIGKAFPPFPGDDEATEQSESYWAEHAVVYNGQPILSSTQTKEWPY